MGRWIVLTRDSDGTKVNIPCNRICGMAQSCNSTKTLIRLADDYVLVKESMSKVERLIRGIGA